MFKYRDNTLCFRVVDNQFALRQIQFQVKSYYITSGQDPDREVKEGLTRSASNTLPNGVALEVSFRIGRKNSASTARWFAEQVKSNQTTFNHNPDELNFALLGKLSIVTAIANAPSNLPVDVFDDIILAQGHTENGSNNWWFGGKNCVYYGCHRVRTQSARGLTYEFRRGGNLPVSEVQIIRS